MLYEAVDAAPDELAADEVFVVVGIGRTSGYEAVLDLRVAGLIIVEKNHVNLGPGCLDDIRHRQVLTTAVWARIVRHAPSASFGANGSPPGTMRAHHQNRTRPCSPSPVAHCAMCPGARWSRPILAVWCSASHTHSGR
ncbi:hypothetical protein [Rhodococcus sp. NBC_00294]|uniref:hypothetical protein n=1 Tax=Rhodococcus sp. NBC_00294 TaxID=2976004 RepID=UPI002E29EFC7|nr:hypothetical protein [Rhodococcus sp. NBC_00294]